MFTFVVFGLSIVSIGDKRYIAEVQYAGYNLEYVESIRLAYVYDLHGVDHVFKVFRIVNALHIEAATFAQIVKAGRVLYAQLF